MSTNPQRPLSEANSVPSQDPESKEQQLRDSIANAHDMTLEAYRQAVTLQSIFMNEVTIGDLLRLESMAKELNLHPLRREIYLVPSPTSGAAIICLGVDGWIKFMNTHEAFSGITFEQSPEDANGLPAWIECTIHRKDRLHPIKVREYLEECRSMSAAWITHPRRMLRHKALIQCARLAFGVGGVEDLQGSEDVMYAPRTREQLGRDHHSKAIRYQKSPKSTQIEPTQMSHDSALAVGESPKEVGPNRTNCKEIEPNDSEGDQPSVENTNLRPGAKKLGMRKLKEQLDAPG